MKLKIKRKPKKFCKACTHSEIYHQWVCSDGKIIWGVCTRTGCDCQKFMLLRPKKLIVKNKGG